MNLILSVQWDKCQSGKLNRFCAGKNDLQIAYCKLRTRQDIGAQALTMREPRKYNVDIACLSEVRMPDIGHSMIRVPGEEAYYHLYHSGAVDHTGRHDEAWNHADCRNGLERKIRSRGHGNTAYPGQDCCRYEVRQIRPPGKFRVGELPVGLQHSLPTPTMSPCNMVLQRRMHQEPN